ncbi:Choline transport protein [Lachnellula occidentalis]|uniref:Choline transport protein n=1 Tax=Lachnellula occidentalis TaxID=215460 RepID=A0A8H8UGJ3_9HELO|nr:Choline transport protein [Lachnellula occidentalis]
MDKRGIELRDMSVAHTLNGAPYEDVRSGTHSRNSDVEKLARMGKKQVLKRRFGFLSLFGFSCTILITWETVLAGGPAGLVYGFILAWLCTLSVYTVISELASIAPIAGGQYFWVSMLAPEGWKRFCSYITGWLTTIAWVATLAVGSVFTGSIIQGMLILQYPNYVPQPYQATMLTWACIVVCIFVNTVVSKWLPKIEGFILIFHILGFFSVLITVLYTAPHGSAESVFATSLNEGGWPTQGLSYCVGFIGNVATFVGADAAVHMSEEIENAALNVPRAIFTTMVLNGALGLAMMIAVLFVIGDAKEVLKSATGFPFIQIFYNSTGSKAGTIVMASLVAALAWAGTIGFTATSSRMLWSFARDRGVPFHQLISKLEPRTSIPMVAVGVVTVIPALLALIHIGSPIVFNDVVSLSVTGFYSSYFLPSALLLWRRTTGHIAEPNEPDSEDIAADAPESFEGQKVLQMQLVWGPWRVPGLFGIINNAFACVYMIFVIFWSSWPPATPVTAATMNYSVVVTVGVIALSMVYYFLCGKRHYIGPLVDAEVLGEAGFDRAAARTE